MISVMDIVARSQWQGEMRLPRTCQALGIAARYRARVATMATAADGPSSDIKVLVAGPDGKMGSTMMTGLPQQRGIEVIGGLRRDDPRTAELLAAADVLVDFTIADSAVSLILSAIEAGVRPVSGTSGLSEDDLRTIDTA